MAQYWASQYFTSSPGGSYQRPAKTDLWTLQQCNNWSIGPSRELTTYSTMLRDATQEAITHPSTAEPPYKRTICPDSKRNRKDFHSATPPFDLRHGYRTQIKKENENEFISLLLECLVHERLVGRSEFVCLRNLLTKICHTPYEGDASHDCGTIVVVQKICGVYYMAEFPTKKSNHQKCCQTKKQKKTIYREMKFKSYVTANPGESQPLSKARKPLNLNEEFCSAVEKNFGSHSITFCTEVDCRKPDNNYVGSSALSNYIELRTTSLQQNLEDIKTFKANKLIQWWLQSYFCGIEKILCGFHDHRGIVRTLKWYDAHDLPEMMIDREPATCLVFLDQFLKTVKFAVTTEFVPHVFTRAAYGNMFSNSLDREGKYKFIPRWFAESVTSVNPQNLPPQYLL